MTKPRWIERRAVLLLHEESLAEHGGRSGFLNEGLLDSALARPQQILSYEPTADLARLGAAYAFGIARNHPFVDGNKRAAFLAAGLFLEWNGFRLEADPVEATQTLLALAAGELSEDGFAAWIRSHLTRRT